MSRRGRPPVKLVLDEKARTELRRRVRAFTSTQREARRARVILACEEHGSAKAAAKALDDLDRKYSDREAIVMGVK